jgi:2'-5' RNA ligase
MARLFFALWPQSAARDALARLAVDVAEHCGGRAVPAAKIHLTLAFLGEVAPGREAAAARAGAGLDADAIHATFDRLGAFPRAGVAWAGCSRVPPELGTLAAGLASGLRAEGFELEDRAFAAHVTLARRIRRKPGGEPIAPIEWRSHEVALVESDRRTGRYVTRGCWALRAR